MFWPGLQVLTTMIKVMTNHPMRSDVNNEDKKDNNNKPHDVGQTRLILNKRVDFENMDRAVTRSIIKRKQDEIDEAYYGAEVNMKEEDIYAVNVPVKEHGHMEAVKAKDRETETLLNFVHLMRYLMMDKI